ncbi:hypothetical protein HZY62_11940 [Maribacter polysiphoniae]|uniref:OmpA family protein n=1 Tax=Maribacter polysiphoniae TaxID=429344 RepID=A0A316E411_9FLAO|nr:hypothetical protein [Maribacter polysiphoniae]MBD1261305.1 hypothetical protein [Maribacter polysiphoniae]PWK23453.1 hypothetical protein LX92_02018 [Maribacter polysiphoniae]
MKQILLSLTLILISTTSIFAQRKSDLIAEIASLKTELDSTKAIVIKAKKNEKVGLARAESFESQVKELQDANATLLKNLNSFAEVSNKNSENINKVMAKLEQKENQLKAINNSIASNDSTSVVVLTNAKQSLGENAKIGIANGSVIIASKLESIFGNTTGTTITAEGTAWLEKIGNILKTNPKVSLTIEGLSMTGELDLAADQASAIGSLLQKQFSIASNRIQTLGKDGNFKEGINLVIHPDYARFYDMVKEHMKASN